MSSRISFLAALGILAGAFHYIERRAMEWERLTVSGDRVIVERCNGSTRERNGSG